MLYEDGHKAERKARIVLADDHDLVRQGLVRMISSDPQLEVVGEASSGKEAVEMCRKLRPDLVLMDVRMPLLDGIAATRIIKSEVPETGVLMVTIYDQPDYLLEAVEAGAAGYVLKDAPKERLLDAVRRTLSGESPINQELAMNLIRDLAEDRRRKRQAGATKAPLTDRPVEPLTPRETEVVRLMAKGRKNSQIAETLSISPTTAKSHTRRIFAKMVVSDRTQAVVRAIELGLIET